MAHIESGKAHAVATGEQLHVMLRHPVDSVRITHERAIEAGGIGVDHKSRIAPQPGETADQQQPYCQQKAPHWRKIDGGGAQIEGEVVAGGEEQQGAARLEQ